MKKQEAKIGLEIHGYLQTREKLFCRCKAERHLAKIGIKPNTNICPICTGQPGSKPQLPNSEAINKIIQIASILGCKINKQFSFQRKHYDWPDMPKGYQNTISGSYSVPVGENGKFEGIGIIEVHLEEDPASWNPQTGQIDYNRSGLPLVEIVTAPQFTSAEQVADWLKKLLISLSYIKAVDKNAGIKADVNVSTPASNFKERIEIKNITSIENIQKAIKHEIQRQRKEKPERETRRFDDKSGKTIRMRGKEEAADYRFIPDPDLPAIKFQEQRIKNIQKQLPETPSQKLIKLTKKYKIKKHEAEILSKNLEIVEFFEQVIKKINPAFALHWITGELLRILNYNKKALDEVDIKPAHFIELLNLIKFGKITELKAKQILNTFIPRSYAPKTKLKKLGKISGKSEIEKICQDVIKKNPKAVQDFKSGKQQALNFLIGQVMKKSQRRADFNTTREIILRLIR